MDIRVETDLSAAASDSLVVFVCGRPLDFLGAVGLLGPALAGALEGLGAQGDLTGVQLSSAVYYPQESGLLKRVVAVGLGPAADLSVDRLRTAAALGAQRVRDLGGRRAAMLVPQAAGVELEACAQAVVEGLILGLYAFEGRPATGVGGVESLAVLAPGAGMAEAVRRGAEAGRVIAGSTNLARDLVNQPPNVCTPEYLAERSHQAALEAGLRWRALGPEDMRAAGMGALLAVAQASTLAPRLVVLEHWPAGSEGQPPIVLVGKGVTFDSGGLSIKPAGDMPSMKADMAGGAAVIGALRAAALLKIGRPVIGLVPASENVVGSAGFRPADVVRASNGKTIEIISTDAEGRLLLADALVYAGRYQPSAVVDVATLTGACAIALGRNMASGVFSNDASLTDRLRSAADRTGERIWPLPLYPEYRDALKSDVADIKNSAGDRQGGVGVSAAFLQEFVGGYRWAHLDIAPMGYRDSPQPPWPRGATGYGVRLLADFLRAEGRGEA